MRCLGLGAEEAAGVDEGSPSPRRRSLASCRRPRPDAVGTEGAQKPARRRRLGSGDLVSPPDLGTCLLTFCWSLKFQAPRAQAEVTGELGSELVLPGLARQRPLHFLCIC